jgi:hypothetical protein
MSSSSIVPTILVQSDRIYYGDSILNRAYPRINQRPFSAIFKTGSERTVRIGADLIELQKPNIIWRKGSYDYCKAIRENYKLSLRKDYYVGSRYMFRKGIDLNIGSQKIFKQEHKTSSYKSKNCFNKKNKEN